MPDHPPKPVSDQPPDRGPFAANDQPPDAPRPADAPPSPDAARVDPYSIEPESAIPMARPAGSPKVATPPDPAPDRRPGVIAAPSVLEGFDDDTDFDKGVTPPPAKPAPLPRASPVAPIELRDEIDEVPVFVRPGLGDARSLAIAAAIVTLIAAAAAGLTAKAGGFPIALATVYETLLHSGTGFAAVVLAAMILGRKVGPPDLAAARMFLAVATFELGASIRLGFSHRTFEGLIACVGYFGLLWLLFRLKPMTVLLVGAIHAAMALAIWLSNIITAWADTAAQPPGAGP